MNQQALASIVMSAQDINSDKHYSECPRVIGKSIPRHEKYNFMAYAMTAHSQNDMNWTKALASDDRDLVIEALENEMESLKSTILTEVHSHDDDFNIACELVTPGRLLLAVKRMENTKHVE